MKVRAWGQLSEIERIDDTTFIHRYECPDIAALAQPGQFLHIRVSQATAPLLRRPISILNSDGKSRVEVLFKVVRTGTSLLAEKREGELLDLVGPLGQPFPYDFDRTAVMVAGGYGIAPMAYLARLNRSSHNTRTLIYGARSKDGIYILPQLREIFDEVLVTTEDGSIGRRGRVTDVLKELVVSRSNLAVYACGPTAMLGAVHGVVAEFGEPGTPTWVSMENQMGCGIGVCLGCVVRTVDGYRTTCTEGPVFSGASVLFED